MTNKPNIYAYLREIESRNKTIREARKYIQEKTSEFEKTLS